jgi:hypothetical protein
MYVQHLLELIVMISLSFNYCVIRESDGECCEVINVKRERLLNIAAATTVILN